MVKFFRVIMSRPTEKNLLDGSRLKWIDNVCSNVFRLATEGDW